MTRIRVTPLIRDLNVGDHIYFVILLLVTSLIRDAFALETFNS